jgi:hypothetical protein
MIVSQYFAENGKFYVPEYNDGMTKQSFKDSTDINKMLKKAQKTGTFSHLIKYPAAVYGEFEGYDLLEAYRMVGKATTIFNDLPSEVRREFQGDAFAFAKYASDPANRARLGELLPAIAAPGTYFPNPVARQEPPPPPTGVALRVSSAASGLETVGAPAGSGSTTPEASSST